MFRAAGAVVATILLTGLLAGCSDQAGDPEAGPSDSQSSRTTEGGDDESFQPSDDDRAAIRDLLKARAKALRDGDRRAFMATVDRQDAVLVHQQRLLFENLQKLPVSSIGYSVDDAAGLLPAEVAGDDPLFQPQVWEQVRLDIDDLPATNELADTFVRREGTWLLGAEGQGDQSRPWGGAVPLAVARSGRLVVVVDKERAKFAPELAEEMVGYIGFAADALGIDPEYDVLVDATSVGQATAMNTVDGEQAAAVTFPVMNFGGDREERLAGTRIKVNPEEADRVISDTLVMRHELTHYLTTRRLAGAPIWVKEGLAEWVSTAPASLDELVIRDPGAVTHVLQVDRRLPVGGLWGMDPRADYLIARAAVTHIVDAYGTGSVFEMARAYARIPGDDSDEKTDRVLRRVLGISEAALVEQTWDDLASLR